SIVGRKSIGNNTWEGEYQLNEQSTTNKNAWEYRAYEFWNKRDGSPIEKAQEILKDPKARLKKHQGYFEDVKGMNVGNICGSNGRKAVPLSLLGADVTVFDISEENKRYALELADYAKTSIDYVVVYIYDMNLIIYSVYSGVFYIVSEILQ